MCVCISLGVDEDKTFLKYYWFLNYSVFSLEQKTPKRKMEINPVAAALCSRHCMSIKAANLTMPVTMQAKAVIIGSSLQSRIMMREINAVLLEH